MTDYQKIKADVVTAAMEAYAEHGDQNLQVDINVFYLGVAITIWPTGAVRPAFATYHADLQSGDAARLTKVAVMKRLQALRSRKQAAVA